MSGEKKGQEISRVFYASPRWSGWRNILLNGVYGGISALSALHGDFRSRSSFSTIPFAGGETATESRAKISCGALRSSLWDRVRRGALHLSGHDLHRLNRRECGNRRDRGWTRKSAGEYIRKKTGRKGTYADTARGKTRRRRLRRGQLGDGVFPARGDDPPPCEALGVEAEDILAGGGRARAKKYGKKAEADGKDAAEGAQKPGGCPKNRKRRKRRRKRKPRAPHPRPSEKAKKGEKKRGAITTEVNKRIAKMDPATFEQPTGDDGFSRPERISGQRGLHFVSSRRC